MRRVPGASSGAFRVLHSERSSQSIAPQGHPPAGGMPKRSAESLTPSWKIGPPPGPEPLEEGEEEARPPCQVPAPSGPAARGLP